MTKHMTYANLMASIAVFVALGGTGYAAVKINGKNIKNKSIAGKKLKNRTITGGKISKGTISSLKGQTGAKGDPGNAGPIGPSNVYASFKDGPVEVPESTDPSTVIATLPNLPPGSYSIAAKLFVTNGGPSTGSVDCDLETGRDFDRTQTAVTGGGYWAALSLNVVRTYERAGESVLKCTDSPDLVASFIKITATRVGLSLIHI